MNGHPNHTGGLRLTWRQWVGLPIMFGMPVLALAGVFGPMRGGLVLRLALIYVLVLICFRVIGKRELSQMTPMELVMLFLVPQLFRNAIMHNDDTLLSAVIAGFTLFSLIFLTTTLAYRLGIVRVVVVPSPSPLVIDGVAIRSALDEERVAVDDILSAARKAGLEGLHEIHAATLESDGRISVVPMDSLRRVVPGPDA